MAELSPRRSATRKALIAIGIFLVTVLMVFVSLALWLRYIINSQIRHIPLERSGPTVTAPRPQSGGVSLPEPVNFLILGSDSRASGGDPHDWEYGAQRSDVMMVAQLSSDRHSMSVMSIPRDAWVDIPNNGMSKINAAYSLGGPELAIASVEQLINAPIHHVMIVDFESFSQLTDRFGGVTIQTAGGRQSFNGQQALAFVRERSSLPNGDFDRARRQQAWLRAMMGKMLDAELLTSPSKLLDTAEIILSHSAVDPGLTADSILGLAYEASALRPSRIEFFTMPNGGPDTSPDGQAIVRVDEAALAPLRDAYRQGNVAAYVRQHHEISTLDKGFVN